MGGGVEKQVISVSSGVSEHYSKSRTVFARICPPIAALTGWGTTILVLARAGPGR